MHNKADHIARVLWMASPRNCPRKQEMRSWKSNLLGTPSLIPPLESLAIADLLVEILRLVRQVKTTWTGVAACRRFLGN